MNTEKETYNQALERIYSEDSTRVGSKEFLIQCIEDGDYDGESYNERFDIMGGVTEEEFNVAQAKWAARKLDSGA